MLEEYLCMGGNEVVNNARAYGYATTAGCPLNWFRCEPCQSIHDAINDWTPATFRWLEARRNLFANPRGTTASATYWGVPAAGFYSLVTDMPGPVNTAVRWTADEAATGAVRVVAGLDMPTNGSVVFRATIRSSIAATVNLYARPQISSATNQALLGTINLVPGINEIDLTSGSFSVATTTTSGIAILTGIATVGHTIDITAVLISEVGGTTFFDGSTIPIDEDIRYRWLGTADLSESVEEVWTLITQGQSGEPPYITQFIHLAPWYDAQDAELTSRFFGAYMISGEGFDDSTRTGNVTESITDGGVVGLIRNASREMRVRALLTAEGEDALEYGLAWLNSALAADSCSSHGSSCGAVDTTFYASCPPPSTIFDMVYDEDDRSRYLHNVTVISGPLITDRFRSNNGIHYGYIVEWTMVAGTPWVFGQTKAITLNPTVPVLIQDVPYNLVPYPSAELATGTVTVATNYAPNPSVEVNATDWTSGSAVVSGTSPAAFLTSARSTAIHAGDGVASFQVRVLGNNGSTIVTNAVSDIYGQTIVPLTVGTGQRFSVTMWGGLFIIAGASGSVITSVTGQAIWRAGTTVLRTDTIGTATTALGGTVFSQKSIVPPATTTNVIIRVQARITWSSSATPANNSDIQLFVDTVAVTTP